MHDLQERYSASRAPSRRWIAWMPLLFVSAFLYWSVALGLGGLSLMAASTLSADVITPTADLGPTAIEPVPGRFDSIVVHLEESTEPEDVNDNAGNPPVSDTSDDDGNDGTGMLTGGL